MMITKIRMLVLQFQAPRLLSNDSRVGRQVMSIDGAVRGHITKVWRWRGGAELVEVTNERGHTEAAPDYFAILSD